LFAAAILGVAIDATYFPEDAPLSVFSAIVSGINCAYFWMSKRVRYVFDNWTGKWSYDDFVRSKTASA
jgi:hypothetical protein